MTTKTVRGRVHGRTIELDGDLGVAEGQEVEVQVKILQAEKHWGDGILRSGVAGRTTRNWMKSWQGFSETGSLSAARKWTTDEPLGNGH